MKQQSKTKIFTVFTFFLLIAIITPVYAELPPEILADRYLLSAKKQIEKGNYFEAAKYFQNIEALGVSVPNAFYFHYGNTLYKKKSFQEAQKKIEFYLTKEGRGGKHYAKALEVLIGIEDAKKQDVKVVKQEWF